MAQIVDTVALELSGYNPTAAAVQKRYFTRKDASIRTGASETPAHTPFIPRAINAGSYDTFIYSRGATGGRSVVGGGVITLDNYDRGLDYLRDWGLDGQELILRTGRRGALYPAAWSTRLIGTQLRAEFSLNIVRLKLRDRLAEVANKLLVTDLFLGTNALPNGVEGVADDLQGKYKPQLWGKAFELPVPMCNTSKKLFIISRRQINSIDAVYDKGAAVTAGTAHGTLAALLAATPAAGTYDYYLGSGSDGAYFRMGTDPTGRVTCDATQGANAAARTVAQIGQSILLNAGELTAGDISSASVTALDTACSFVVGYWSGTSPVKLGDAMDEIFQSIGAFWGPARVTGLFSFGQLAAPTGSAVLTIKEHMVAREEGGIEIQNGTDPGLGVPIYELVLGYKKIYQTQTRLEVAGVALTRSSYLESQFRTVPATDTAVKTKHALSESIQQNSLITDAADAATEATRRHALYKTDRDYVKVLVPRQFTETLELNAVVSLQLPYFSWTSGKLMRVLGIGEDFNSVYTSLWLWG